MRLSEDLNRRWLSFKPKHESGKTHLDGHSSLVDSESLAGDVSLSFVEESRREGRIRENPVDDESERSRDSSDEVEDVDPGVDRKTKLDDSVRHTEEDDLEATTDQDLVVIRILIRPGKRAYDEETGCTDDERHSKSLLLLCVPPGRETRVNRVQNNNGKDGDLHSDDLEERRTDTGFCDTEHEPLCVRDRSVVYEFERERKDVRAMIPL